MVEQTSSPPWNYENAVRTALTGIKGLLDMGTGNGEFLASLAPLPCDTCATEGWAPNITIARQKLTPLGVTVTGSVRDKRWVGEESFFAADEFARPRLFSFVPPPITDNDIRLPLNDARFDLIINRHGTYSPFEVHRLLKTEGLFITQQIGDHDNDELNSLLEAPELLKTTRGWNLSIAAEELQNKGFNILEQYEAFVDTQFYDVRDVKLYLKTISYQIQEFSIDRYSDQLVALERRIKTDGPVSFRSHRFFVMAQKQ